jgi:invasion protein IalB
MQIIAQRMMFAVARVCPYAYVDDERVKLSMYRMFSVALGFCLAVQPAVAQGLGGQNQGPNQWVANCSTERGRDCTVSAMIDGDSLLGTFALLKYSVASATLSVMVDGTGQRASIRVDQWPFISTSLCTGAVCSWEPIRSAELLEEFRRGHTMTLQVSLQGDNMVGPLQMSLRGFSEQYQKALQAQQGR